MPRSQDIAWDKQLQTDVTAPPLPKELLGMPQVFCTTSEMLPVVLGAVEFQCKQCVLLTTPQMPGGRFVDALNKFDIEVLNPQDEKSVLSPGDVVHNAGVGKHVMALAKKHDLRGLLWNYTPGTKQMFLGLYRSFALGDSGDILKEMFYVDTSQRDPLWLSRESAPRTLSTRFSVDDIIAANGCVTENCFILTKASTTPPPMGGEIRQWVEQGLKEGALETFNDKRRIGVGGGDWLNFHVADALVRTGRVKEAFISVQMAPASSTLGDGTEQELDVMISVNNTLVGIECKWTNKIDANWILKLASVTRELAGGRFAVPAMICKQPPSGVQVHQTGSGKKARSAKVALVYWNSRSLEKSLHGLDDAILPLLAPWLRAS